MSINSKAKALKRVREAQNKANEARLERERQNAAGAAPFLVELGRLAAVDEWEQTGSLRFAPRGSVAVMNTAWAAPLRWRVCRAAVRRLRRSLNWRGWRPLNGARRR
ncbi:MULTISPECIES: hypothetical protein [Mycobacterium]|uniref:hypothetical protein n=1 Tax=Mycobacterium TaxID=1763 RepID=UPI001CE04E8E|nr:MULTISPECIES: hypothetical protein [Mycobacterium]